MKKILSEIEMKEINKFGKFELTASHVYLHLAITMKTLGYFGAEKFFISESLSEREHFEKLSQFANNLGEQISIPAVSIENYEVNSIKEALEIAYEMENDLLDSYEKATELANISTKVKLLFQDFTTHQVGAVGEYGDLIARLSLTTDMLLFDNELGK
jgi:ferritin